MSLIGHWTLAIDHGNLFFGNLLETFSVGDSLEHPLLHLCRTHPLALICTSEGQAAVIAFSTIIFNIVQLLRFPLTLTPTLNSPYFHTQSLQCMLQAMKERLSLPLTRACTQALPLTRACTQGPKSPLSFVFSVHFATLLCDHSGPAPP